MMKERRWELVDMCEKMKLIWIGGTGRCGTNLMKYLLELNDDVRTLNFEIKLLIEPDGILDFYNSLKTNWSPQMVHVKYLRMACLLKDISEKGGLYPDWELKEHIPEFKEKTDRFLESVLNFSFQGKWNRYSENRRLYYVEPDIERIRKCIYKYFTGLFDGSRIYVDDGTYNLFYSHHIKEIFPESKFIHMKRDFLQVIGSMKKQGWCPTEIDDLCKWYKDSITKIEESLKRLDGNDYINVNMEELVDNSLETMERICDFLGIERIKKTRLGTFDFSKKKDYSFSDEELEKIKINLF